MYYLGWGQLGTLWGLTRLGRGQGPRESTQVAVPAVDSWGRETPHGLETGAGFKLTSGYHGVSNQTQIREPGPLNPGNHVYHEKRVNPKCHEIRTADIDLSSLYTGVWVKILHKSSH